DAFAEGENPFLASQLVLCPLSFLVENPERDEQALACDWDMLVVDEAHHLEWAEDKASEEYECVERLAERAQGVLLLTATPEQLGVEGHFARLRLLDPDRYYDLPTFVNEDKDYQAINEMVQCVLDAKAYFEPLPDPLASYLTPREWQSLEAVFLEDAEAAYDKAVDALLDRHGTGRVLFRNTRAAVRGFPKRHVTTYELAQVLPETEEKVSLLDRLRPENFYPDSWLKEDARVEWLVRWLADHNSQQVLLICANADTAIELEQYLRVSYGINSGVFHEGMSLVARDRAAAYFADEEGAAQILVCSEIGSEGRNFQFVNNIILFDLPINPDLLEQRIGRLDRIGQLMDIDIHVPLFKHSEQEVLFRWYHEGLNAFEVTCAIGRAVFDEFETELMACLEHKQSEPLAALINDTHAHAEQLRDVMQQGRDQLLEMNSCRLHEASSIIDRVLDVENRRGLERFVDKATSQLGIDTEPHSPNTIILKPTEQMTCGAIDGIDEDGMTATFSRELALSREDMAYFSWEHPTVKGLLDAIIQGEQGSTGFSTLKLSALKEGTLLLEGLFAVDCIAPPHLQIERYLPSNVIRVVVNLQGKNLAAALPADKLNSLLKSAPMESARAIIKNAHALIEKLMDQATHHAQESLVSLLDDAVKRVVESQETELFRLQNLAEINSNIRASEIDAIKADTIDLVSYLEQTSVKSDAVRLIMSV
ncbi:MAG: RNA polymerase-associated protein RapA, partial [Pseudomonadota bacterium]